MMPQMTTCCRPNSKVDTEYGEIDSKTLIARVANGYRLATDIERDLVSPDRCAIRSPFPGAK